MSRVKQHTNGIFAKRPRTKGPLTAASMGFVPRRGKWLKEEEEFALAIISAFRSGVIPLNEGVTLRFFLCHILKCEPMRISKKFTGEEQIGKQLFKRREVLRSETTQVLQTLATLELNFLNKLEGKASNKHTPCTPFFSTGAMSFEVPQHDTKRRKMTETPLSTSPTSIIPMEETWSWRADDFDINNMSMVPQHTPAMFEGVRGPSSSFEHLHDCIPTYPDEDRFDPFMDPFDSIPIPYDNFFAEMNVTM